MNEKNRNTLLFVVLSMALLGGYTFIMNRLYPTQNQPQASQIQPDQTPQNPTSSPEMKPSPTPLIAPVPTINPKDPQALFTFHTATLNLTWRKQDGALVQVIWKTDGTKFFPEAVHEKHISPFLGIGGALATTFEGEPDVLSQDGGHEIVFHNSMGDRLGYWIPSQGHILNVNWSTTRGTHLCLVRSLHKLPKETIQKGAQAEEIEVNPFHNLGRVFTIQDKGIESVTWADMFQDPFFLFRFFGSKRKVLPPTSNRIGMDAGLDPSNDSQRSHYFAAIWDASTTAQRDTTNYPGYHVAPDATGKASARLYLGPKQEEELMKFHPKGNPEQGKPFVKVMDYGFFGLIAQLLFLILKSVHKVIPNWGWAIVVFTLIIRALLWPLNNKTTISMMRMKELEPHQKALQAKYEKFGNDMAKKQEMQKELMAFYKKNGHNPMGGCLPMLLQMPVFFALWSMLNAVFELRHAPFMGWIGDLSTKDPYYVLPVLMGISMFIQQKMTPATGDPAQRKMMLFLMPGMMIFMFAGFPSGLNLYYLIFNIVGIAQTWWVMKHYQPQPVKI